MSEEEIINVLKNLMEKNKQIVKEAYKSKDINAMELVADEDREAIAIFKILDLYQKEKEKNKILSIQIIENEKLYDKETERLGNLLQELLEGDER